MSRSCLAIIAILLAAPAELDARPARVYATLPDCILVLPGFADAFPARPPVPLGQQPFAARSDFNCNDVLEASDLAAWRDVLFYDRSSAAPQTLTFCP